MADRSHLIPTPITDKSGKQTTVYRRPISGPDPIRSLPAPSIAAPSVPTPGEEYAERRAAIREQNASWRSGDRTGSGEAKSEALHGMQHLAWLLAESRDKPASERLCRKLSLAVEGEEHSTIGLAGYYARHYCVIKNELDINYTDPDRLERSPYWESYGATDAGGVITVAHTLLSLDLINYTDVPSGTPDERLMAHLWAHATGYLDYNEPQDEIGETVRLIDERPDYVNQIVNAHLEGLHGAAIRALLDGETTLPLSPGAL